MTSDDRHARRVEAGRWLKRTRERAGYTTATEFAAALGYDKSIVSSYETGRTGVPDDRAERIAAVLQIPLITVRRGLGLWVPGSDSDDTDESADTTLDELRAAEEAMLTQFQVYLREAYEAGLRQGRAEAGDDEESRKAE